ncbi:MAG TPA: copper-binding protein [Gammaproteobacteria bacterium]|nr:copper-binding protein [Gammaproteobacteria bacterium]
MKNITLLVLVTASSMLAACGRDEAPSAPSASNMPNMPAGQPPAGGPAAAENHGVGVVQSVDAASGSLTIAHEPIAALGWPAMTMSFKVDKPVLLEGVEAGKHIEFTLRGRDMSAVVTSIDETK